MRDIVCTKCGLMNSTNIVEKNRQKVCFCAGCGAYIKNIGYAEDKFYIGKYKGRKVCEVDDKNYLSWFLNESSIKKSPKMREAIEEKIKKLLL